MSHICPACLAPCNCSYDDIGCIHCDDGYDLEAELIQDDLSELNDAEPTSRSIDRENAREINRRREER